MNIYGKLSKGTEYLIGSDQDDVIYPLGGSDLVDGKKGYDLVVVEWPSTGFVMTTVEGVTYLDSVSGASGADRTSLRNVESVRFSDRTISLEVPDRFANTPGSDSYNGGPGLDTVAYNSPRAAYNVQAKEGGLSVTRIDYTEGGDWLQDIERLVFSDVTLAFDSQGAAGTTLRVLGAVFGAQAIHNTVYAGIGMQLLEQKGFSPDQLMALALQARLGAQAQDPQALVQLLYSNVVGAAPSPAQAEPFVQMLQSGAHSPVSLAWLAANTDLNLTHVGLMGAVFQGLEFTPQS